MTKRQKYEAVPTMDWFQKGLIKEQKGQTVRVYYYLLACSKPHYDEHGNFIDLRTSEKDTGKASKLYNNRKKKTKGILNIDDRTYNGAINILTQGKKYMEYMYYPDGTGPIGALMSDIPPLIESIHKEKTDNITKSQMKTEFIIKPLEEMPGFQFSKVDKDLLKTLSIFKNKYIISVLAHLLWLESANKTLSEKNGKPYIPPTFCNTFICRGFGMENPSHEQRMEIQEAVLMLEGAGILETEKVSIKGLPFRRLLKINNNLPQSRELDEGELSLYINSQTGEEKFLTIDEIYEERRNKNKDELSIYDF